MSLATIKSFILISKNCVTCNQHRVTRHRSSVNRWVQSRARQFQIQFYSATLSTCIKLWGKFPSQYNATVFSLAAAAFIFHSLCPWAGQGSIPGGTLEWAIAQELPIHGVTEDQPDHRTHLDSLGALRNGSYGIWDRHNKIVDSARFTHFLASVEAVYCSNKPFRAAVQPASRVRWMSKRQFFAWFKGTHQENQWAGSTRKYQCGLFFLKHSITKADIPHWALQALSPALALCNASVT